MKKLITKRNIATLNFVFLGLFVITLVAVAVPFIKNEPVPSLFSDEKRPTQRLPVSPTPQETYTCARHPKEKSDSPGKCPQCGEALEKLNRYAMIADRDLFDAHLVEAPKEPEFRPEPLRWELVGVTIIDGKPVASIRDRSSATRGSAYKGYLVREGEEVEGFFGVKILSITADPPMVKYERLGVGIEELTMGQTAAGPSGTGADPWKGIIYPMVAGSSYGVRLRELRARIPNLEAYRQSFGLQPNMVGSRMEGLKITSLRKENFLYAAGLRVGDIITKINNSPITDEGQALNLLRSAASKPTIRVEIQRGRRPRILMYTLRK